MDARARRRARQHPRRRHAAEKDGWTRVVLRHTTTCQPRTTLPTQDYIEQHRSGWQLYLGRLRTRLQGGRPGPDPTA